MVSDMRVSTKLTVLVLAEDPGNDSRIVFVSRGKDMLAMADPHLADQQKKRRVPVG